METTHTEGTSLHFDKTQNNVTRSLGISDERHAEISQQYKTAIQEFEARVSSDDTATTADLYDSVKHIPQNVQEAFYIGQSVGRLDEEMKQSQSGLGAFAKVLAGVIGSSMLPKQDAGKNTATKADDCGCPACELRRALQKRRDARQATAEPVEPMTNAAGQ